MLNSLEFKFGFAHCELMEENGEFYLIELNPRISGAQGANCLMAQNQVGVDHVDSYLKCLGEEPIKHNNRKEYSLVYFFKNRIGKYNSVDTSLIESLKSIRKITVLKKHYDSDDVKHTLMDVSMLVVLESNNESSLSSDFKQLEYLERTGAPFI
ncbi:hypothetical protein F0265_08370 [Vibrio sp. RE88]|nr:hypothetical protein [Vibrio sp. RE88]